MFVRIDDISASIETFMLQRSTSASMALPPASKTSFCGDFVSASMALPPALKISGCSDFRQYRWHFCRHCQLHAATMFVSIDGTSAGIETFMLQRSTSAPVALPPASETSFCGDFGSASLAPSAAAIFVTMSCRRRNLAGTAAVAAGIWSVDRAGARHSARAHRTTGQHHVQCRDQRLWERRQWQLAFVLSAELDGRIFQPASHFEVRPDAVHQCSDGCNFEQHVTSKYGQMLYINARTAAPSSSTSLRIKARCCTSTLGRLHLQADVTSKYGVMLYITARTAASFKQQVTIGSSMRHDAAHCKQKLKVRPLCLRAVWQQC